MKKVTIKCSHPISGGISYYKYGEFECPVDLTNPNELGPWLSKKVGFAFNYKPGMSRFDREAGKCFFFPYRRQVGIHCVWVEEVVAEGVSQ